MGNGGQNPWPLDWGSVPVPAAWCGWMGWAHPRGWPGDTAAAGRARLSCTKLLFSEAPSSPGLEPVGGRGAAGMCRVRRGCGRAPPPGARSSAPRLLTQLLPPPGSQPGPQQSVSLPLLDCGPGGPSHTPTSALPPTEAGRAKRVGDTQL